MKTIISVWLAMLLLSSNGFGQRLEQGETDELKGQTKVFVDAGGDAETRRAIVGEIEAARLGIEFMKTVEECSVLLKFNGQIEEITTGAAASNDSSAIKPNVERLSVGQGIVALAGQDDIRVLMRYGKARQSNLQPQSAAKFAREFIRLYKRANRLK